MKRNFFILVLVLLLGVFDFSIAFGKDYDDGLCYTNFSKKELMRDLAFSENQIFGKVYSSDSITERLERLEIGVFGAIQDGREDFRIKRLKKSVTNVASGGNGLNSVSKILNLGGNAMGSSSWVIGNMHNSYPYSNTYYRNRYPAPYHRGYSHRLPPPPPPHSYNYNNNPIINGDFMKNYSIGTGIKILDD